MRAELADGRVLEFPDGTDPAVVQATVKKTIAGHFDEQKPPDQPPGMMERMAGAGVRGFAQGGPLGALAGAGGEGMNIASEKLAEFGDTAGQKTTDLATGAGAPPQLAAGAGAAVNTAIQGAPMLLGAGGEAKTVANAAERIEPTLKAAVEHAEQAVKAAGVDWTRLGRQARVRLSQMAKDALASGKPLDQAAVDRVARAESVGVKMTKGQAARDAGQMRVEENLAQTTPGKPISERFMEQDAALQDHIDILKGKTGARSADAEATGDKVDTALKKAESLSNANVNKLYNKARAQGELEKTIELDPIIKAVKENPQAKKMLIEQLGAMDLVKADKFGQPMATHDITLNQLERVRRRATTVARTSTDGVQKHDASELVKAIDSNVPDTAGGEAYKAARAARKEHAMQFEEPKAISQIIENKTATDRKTALEDVWKKTVLSKTSSIADVTRVRDTLLKSTDRQTRDAGRKAWRDMAGQTVDYIKNEAKGTVNQKGEYTVTPAGLKKAIENIGDKKLELLLGKDVTKQLHAISDTASDLQMPRYRSGSTTVPNVLSMLDHVLAKVKHVPGIGDIGRGLVTGAENLKKSGAATKQVKEALGTNSDAEKSSSALPSLRRLLAPVIGLGQEQQNARQ